MLSAPGFRHYLFSSVILEPWGICFLVIPFAVNKCVLFPDLHLSCCMFANHKKMHILNMQFCGTGEGIQTLKSSVQNLHDSLIHYKSVYLVLCQWGRINNWHSLIKLWGKLLVHSQGIEVHYGWQPVFAIEFL